MLGQPGPQVGELVQALLPGPLRGVDGRGQPASSRAALAVPACVPSLPDVSAAAASASCSRAAASARACLAWSSSSSPAASCRSARWHCRSAPASCSLAWLAAARSPRRLGWPADPPRAQCVPSRSPSLVTSRRPGSSRSTVEAGRQVIDDQDAAQQLIERGRELGRGLHELPGRQNGRTGLSLARRLPRPERDCGGRGRLRTVRSRGGDPAVLRLSPDHQAAVRRPGSSARSGWPRRHPARPPRRPRRRRRERRQWPPGRRRQP